MRAPLTDPLDRHQLGDHGLVVELLVALAGLLLLVAALRADRVVGSCFYCVWTMRKNFFGSLETQMPNGTVLVAPVTSPLP